MNESKHSSDTDSKVRIEIVKYKWLFNALENPQHLWRLLISLSAMLVILFFGLSMVAVIIKSMFPYETIRTNPYGAMIMEDEKKEVVYWLFNSADLWANSGIRVEKGDVLTIRSSGMMHTAIHHLVNEVEENKELTESWVNTDGIRSVGEPGSRNDARAEFRLAGHIDQNKLVMRVVDDDDIDTLAHNHHIFVIGKERTNLIMTKDGVLQFSVNDIAMTPKVIEDLYLTFIDQVCDKYKLDQEHKKAWKSFYTDTYKKGTIDTVKFATYAAEIAQNDKLNTIVAKVNPKDSELPGVALGVYYERDSLYPILNEALYYNDTGFEEAWFVDNVGSFLIVIERNKKN